MGELLLKSVVLMCGYAVMLSALPWLHTTWPTLSTTWVSLPMIALFGYSSFRFLRGSGWPLSRFGLGFRNLPSSLLEATLLTPPFALVLVGVKWIVVHVVPTYRGLPVIAHSGLRGTICRQERPAPAGDLRRVGAGAGADRALRAAGQHGGLLVRPRQDRRTHFRRCADVLGDAPAHVVLVRCDGVHPGRVLGLAISPPAPPARRHAVPFRNRRLRVLRSRSGDALKVPA